MLQIPNRTALEKLEQDELVAILRRHFPELVEVMLEEESYTKKGRMNKSAITRRLKWKTFDLEEKLKEARTILKQATGEARKPPPGVLTIGDELHEGTEAEAGDGHM